MCVAVTMSPGAELTEQELTQMGNANGDGFGFAWAEDGVVYWWKTLNYDPSYLAYVINERKHLARLVHFRLSTVGGVKLELCHPFEVGPLASGQANGHGSKVLIHNGHWWRAEDIFKILNKEGAIPDNGPWSDTRLAAMLASWDEDWLTTVTGKVATLDGDGNFKLTGDWADLREGIKVSNKSWESHTYDYKKTGASKWVGWGWGEKEWAAKDAHDRAKAELRKKEEEAEKEKEKNGEKEEKTQPGKGGHGKGQKGGVDSEAGTVYDSHGKRVGGRGFNPGVRAGRQIPVQDGAGEKDEEKAKGGSASGSQKTVRVYDYTPWQNPETGEWWQVDSERTTGDNYALRRLDDDAARAILEQIAASSGEAG